MKRTLSSVLAGLMVIQSAPLFAQNNNPTTPMPVILGAGGGGKGSSTEVFNASGPFDYNRTLQDLSKNAELALGNLKDVQEIDRKYMTSLSERYTALLKDLADLKMKFEALGALSVQGRQQVTGQDGKLRASVGKEKWVKLSEYVELVLEINNRDQILRNELQTLSLMTRQSLPSYSPARFADKEYQGHMAGNVDTKALVDGVEKLRAQMIADMNNIKFINLSAAANQTKNITANALTLDLSGLRTLEEEDRSVLQATMEEKRILKEKTIKLHKNMVDKTVNVINTYVAQYGTQEWLRFTNENDVRAARESYMNVIDAFMRRSYLRKKFGIRIGAIQSRPYDKEILGWEQYGLQYQPLKIAVSMLYREAAIKQEDVNSAFESARNFLELYDKKTTAIFGGREETMKKDIKKEDYSSKDTGFLVRANSAITFVTGQMATAEILLSIMRLVLADAREEQVLFRNAKTELALMHNSRYRATSEMKVENNRTICEMDFTIDDDTFNEVCPSLGVDEKAEPVVSVDASSGISDIFSALLVQYRNTESGRWQEAANIQKQLDADLAAGYNTTDLDEVKKKESTKNKKMFK